MIRHKENIITSLLIATTFLFFVFTPVQERLGGAVQGFIIALIFFGFLPLGYHFLVLRKEARFFGIEKDNLWQGWLLMVPTVLGALIVTILCYQWLPAFRTEFLLPQVVQDSFSWFVGYELLLVPILTALYELFFRGFVQKSWLEAYWGGWAIIAQGALFVVFLLMTASFTWALFPLILFSFCSGFLVWKNNSLLQAWLSQWLYLLTLDIFILITGS